jgi:hypothetical protein
MTQAGVSRRLLPRGAAVRVSKNLKTALVLASVVIVFFAGIVVRHWLWPAS